MSKLVLTQEHVEAALIGGCFLGGGGGGSMAKGRALAERALAAGTLTMISADEIDDDAILLTSSAVGAPAAKDAYAAPDTATRVVELLEQVGIGKPSGLITNENGGGSTFNGWLPAAVSGLPFVDLPCNGRAHPTGMMGGMALHRDKNYTSYQSSAGGKRENGTYIESLCIGSIESASALVRQSAVRAGGLVSVARNPITAGYAKKFCAPGGVMLAIEVGRKMQEASKRKACASAEAAADFLGGSVIAYGSVDGIELITEGGFDHGTVNVGGLEMTFWNEFMTADMDGKRLGTFPDLIMTVDAETGLPVTTAEISKGQNVIVVLVPARNLPLGAGMYCRELMAPVEEIVRRPILSYFTLEHPYL